MDDLGIQFLSSLSPKIDRNKKIKKKGPTVLSLKKHFRKSLSFDQFDRITPNASLSIIEISSDDSGCSNNVRQLTSCSKIIDNSSSEIGNALHSDISTTYHMNSNNDEVIPPSPDRKKIYFECVSTSKKKELNKLDCRKVTKTKLSEIMKWMENVNECNEKVIQKENIQTKNPIEGSLLSYDEFKDETEENQVLNSTMIPDPMQNNDYTDQEINGNVHIDMSYRQEADFENLGSKFPHSKDKGLDCNKSCENLLDELYGASWRLKKDEVLSKSEKKPTRKKVIEMCPKSERKPKRCDFDRKESNQNNLLRTLQTRRLKKAKDSPHNIELCNEKQYDENDSLKSITRGILDCDTDIPKKKTEIEMSQSSDKQINSFGIMDLKKYNNGNNSNFSNKENISCGEIITSEYSGGKEGNDRLENILKENGEHKNEKRKIRKDTKKTDINKKEKQTGTETTDKLVDGLPDSKYISNPIKAKGEKCIDVEKVKITRKKLTECYTCPTDSYQDKITVTNEKNETFNELRENSYSFLASLSKNIPDSKCHISAKIFKCNYKQHKENLARKLFNLYNEKVFDNALPNTTALEWSSRMSTTAGFCCSKKITHRSGDVERVTKIVLSAKVLDSPDRLRDTLIHEMCHAATWIVNQVSNGHGEYWIAWTMKARQVFPELPPIKRCHNYQINTKYVYRCIGCSYSIGRHRKSIDIERKRCGYCLGKFEVLINKINKKGEEKTVPVTAKRKPNGFALFVKENYSNFKEPGLNHGSVMKLLSEKFKEMKV